MHFASSIAVLSLAFVGGCRAEYVDDNTSDDKYRFTTKIITRGPVNLIVDASTGCEYLITNQGAITPRLGPDAIPNCSGTVVRLNDVEM